jgi:hypothetical protein
MALVISSLGGNLHAAYKIATLLRKKCKRLIAFVPDDAKSAASFLCLAADEIVFSEKGELGPLDSQHESPEDPEKYVSALESFKALDAIRRFAFETLDAAILTYEAKGRMTMVEALPRCTEFVGKIVDPLFRNFDVRKLGEYGRSLEVAQDYALRVMTRYSYKERERLRLIRTVSDLIWKYPSHGQVIDLDECRRLGLNGREATKEENELLCAVSDEIRNLSYVGTLTVEGKDGQPESKEEGKQSNSD